MRAHLWGHCPPDLCLAQLCGHFAGRRACWSEHFCDLEFHSWESHTHSTAKLSHFSKGVIACFGASLSPLLGSIYVLGFSETDPVFAEKEMMTVNVVWMLTMCCPLCWQLACVMSARFPFSTPVLSVKHLTLTDRLEKQTHRRSHSCPAHFPVALATSVLLAWLQLPEIFLSWNPSFPPRATGCKWPYRTILSQSQYVNIPLFCPLGGITLESALNQLPEFPQGVYPSGAHTVFSGLPCPCLTTHLLPHRK